MSANGLNLRGLDLLDRGLGKSFFLLAKGRTGTRREGNLQEKGIGLRKRPARPRRARPSTWKRYHRRGRTSGASERRRRHPSGGRVFGGHSRRRRGVVAIRLASIRKPDRAISGEPLHLGSPSVGAGVGVLVSCSVLKAFLIGGALAARRGFLRSGRRRRADAGREATSSWASGTAWTFRPSRPRAATRCA